MTISRGEMTLCKAILRIRCRCSARIAGGVQAGILRVEAVFVRVA